jgi:hypothetical protein
MRNYRYSLAQLKTIALADANAAQRATLDTVLANGFTVTTLWHSGAKVAIGLQAPTFPAIITPDGKLHRPVKGKSKVSINPRTLERVY